MSVTGNDLEKYLRDHWPFSPGWQLPRNPDQNTSYRLTGIIMAYQLTNKVVGQVLKENSNTIILFKQIDFSFPFDKEKSILETLYKREIYVYSIGEEWLSKTITAAKMYSEIFGLQYIQTLSDKLMGKSGYILSDDNPKNGNTLLSRIKDQTLLFNGKDTSTQMYQSVLYLSDGPYIGEALEKVMQNNVVDMIVIHEYTIALDHVATKFQSDLVLIQTSVMQNELVRELYYMLHSEIQTKLNIKPLLVFQKVSVVKFLETETPKTIDF